MIFLCDRYTSNPYLQVSILRHGQIILTELNIQYQPVENRPFSKMMHFSFLWYLLIPLLCVLFFFCLHLSKIYSIFIYLLACRE